MEPNLVKERRLNVSPEEASVDGVGQNVCITYQPLHSVHLSALQLL